ncbi:hypothetical protein V8E54_003176 [Elaphomyces granulatus]
MPNDTAYMSSSNNSTSRESTVAMPIPSGSTEATAQASAQASGVASNAFGIRDNQGVVPLSLPPEGTFESWEAVKKAANAHAGLAGYALVEGKGARRDPDNKFRWKRFLICKHGESHCLFNLPSTINWMRFELTEDSATQGPLYACRMNSSSKNHSPRPNEASQSVDPIQK